MADSLKFLDKSGVSTLWGKVLDEIAKAAPSDYESVKAQVEANKTKLGTVDTDLEAAKAAIAILNSASTVDGSVGHTVAVELAKIVGEGELDESYDTLKEISDWIVAHPESVAEINSKITALENLVGAKAVAEQIAEALKIYAKTADLDAYATKESLTAYATVEALNAVKALIPTIEALSSGDIDDAIAAVGQE